MRKIYKNIETGGEKDTHPTKRVVHLAPILIWSQEPITHQLHYAKLPWTTMLYKAYTPLPSNSDCIFHIQSATKLRFPYIHFALTANIPFSGLAIHCVFIVNWTTLDFCYEICSVRTKLSVGRSGLSQESSSWVTQTFTFFRISLKIRKDFNHQRSKTLLYTYVCTISSFDLCCSTSCLSHGFNSTCVAQSTQS